MDKNRAIEVLDMIAKDAKDDATNFDGKPFTGRVVAEYFGNHGASISKLSEILKAFIKGEIA
jgi:hypothetical protein